MKRALRNLETGTLSDIGAPSGEYVAPGHEWVDVPDDARHSDTWDGETLTVRPMPADPGPSPVELLVEELDAAGVLTADALGRIRGK